MQKWRLQEHRKLLLQVSGSDAATAPSPAVCKLNFTFDIAPNILCRIQNKTSKTEHVAPASVSRLVTSAHFQLLSITALEVSYLLLSTVWIIR